MGLLDDVLGQLAGGGRSGGPGADPFGRAAPTGRGMGGAMPPGAGGGMGNVLAALLPIVLSMLANRQRAAPVGRAGFGPGPGMGEPASGGGLGDILGQILGGAAGGLGGAAGGGLGGLLEQMQRAGYGDQASSWVSRGQNQPVPPEAMEQVFGRDVLSQIARRIGASEQETAEGLSQILPEVVDRVTPEGNVPDLDSLSSSVDDLARRIGFR